MTPTLAELAACSGFLLLLGLSLVSAAAVHRRDRLDVEAQGWATPVCPAPPTRREALNELLAKSVEDVLTAQNRLLARYL